MRRFYSYQLWFLIPGIALVVAGVFIPLNYLHKQLFWTETEALITEEVLRYDGAETELFYHMAYTDEEGLSHHIQVSDENTFVEGKDSMHVCIYYDQSNPTNYELVNPGRYMLILFIPLGLLACYFGWPERAVTKGPTGNI